MLFVHCSDVQYYRYIDYHNIIFHIMMIYKISDIDILLTLKDH